MMIRSYLHADDFARPQQVTWARQFVQAHALVAPPREKVAPAA